MRSIFKLKAKRLTVNGLFGISFQHSPATIRLSDSKESF